MESYDKKFVYFDWDKELDGKKGFVAQNIASLRRQVKDNPEAMVTLSSSDDDVCPFTYFCDDEIACDYQFAYYDPDYEAKKALMEGKTIQYNSGHGWEDCCDNNPSWACNVEYRIKDTYIPFDTVDELIKCWEKKFPGNANRPEYTMPLIWIKRKDRNRVYLISDFLFDKSYGNDVGTYESDYKLKDLFNDFTFLDGSIIGKRSK